MPSLDDDDAGCTDLDDAQARDLNCTHDTLYHHLTHIKRAHRLHKSHRDFFADKSAYQINFLGKLCYGPKFPKKSHFQSGPTMSPNFIRFQSSVRLIEVGLG